jgi:anti-sigma factor RsiW
MVVWEEAGLRYWAVSDVAPEELEAFAELLRKRTGAS